MKNGRKRLGGKYFKGEWMHKITNKNAKEFLKNAYLFGYIKALERTHQDIGQELRKFSEFDKYKWTIHVDKKNFIHGFGIEKG